MRSRLERICIQTLLIQLKKYSPFWSDNKSELDTTFPIEDLVSICQDLNFFDIILPLFCKYDRLDKFLKQFKIEIKFVWNVTL